MMVFFQTRLGKILIWAKFSEMWESDFNSNYEKLAKCNPTFWRDKFFSILLKYWQVSMMLSELSFSQDKFQMVNICNGGTKDFVELWEIIIWKCELIFPSDKWNYSQLT